MTKEEYAEEIERDRELEMRQDAYDERMELAKIALLHTEPESIVDWTEWQEFEEALSKFKNFCNSYDLDINQEIKEML